MNHDLNPIAFLSGSTGQRQFSQLRTFLSTVTVEIIAFIGTPHLDTYFWMWFTLFDPSYVQIIRVVLIWVAISSSPSRQAATLEYI